MRPIRILSLLLSCLLLTACASDELRHVEENFKGISPEYLQIGDNVSAIAQATHPIIHDQVISDYLLGIKKSLLTSSSVGNVPGRIYVFRDPAVYGYSLPNGDIYISSGLLRLAGNDAELASVLGHELGHILLGHFQKAWEQQARFESALARSDKQGSSPRDDMDASFMAVMHFGTSREWEREADRIMLQLQERSGYDPCGAQLMFSKLVELGQQGDVTADKTRLFDTHPSTPERLHDIDEQLDGKGCDGKHPAPTQMYRKNVLDRLITKQ